MNFFKLFLLGAFFLTIASCGKDDDVTIDPTPDSTYLKCKIDGADFEVTGLFAYASVFDTDNSIGVYGIEDATVEGYRTFIISIDDAGVEGSTYDLSDPGNGYGSLILSSPEATYYTNIDGGSGTMTVTSRNETTVEGTFSFTGVNTNDVTDVVQITEGTYKVDLR